MEGLSSIYADFICETSYDKLPPEVIKKAKQQILDLVGVSLAGYKLVEFPQLVVNYIASLGGSPQATIFATKQKFPAINTVMANTICAHALDMDDGHRYAALHPGAVVIPTAIAAAEMVGADTSELIAGVVVGYEVMIRIGMAINPSSLRRGFHTTGTVGAFGAAATAANIMRLSHEETVSALGITGLQGAGLLQVNHEAEGAKVKPINPAKAAMSGLFSSILSQKGARGPVNILEGEDGFLRAMADEINEEVLPYDLGQRFEICNVYTKFYAACRHVHASIDAALKAQRDGEVDIAKIREISVETYPAALRLAGIEHPTTTSAARFSIPFSVALALIKRDASAVEYSEENIRDKGIQSLASKVRLLTSGEWERLYPDKRGATVTITDAENRAWSAEVDLAKGEPENPGSEADIYNKFLINATLLRSDKLAKLLGDSIVSLEKTSLDEFIKLI